MICANEFYPELSVFPAPKQTKGSTFMLRQTKFLLYTTVFAIALVSGGCALTPVAIDTVLELIPTPQVEEATPVVTREPTPLEQTTWVLQSLSGDSYFPEVEITMEFRPNSHPLGDILGGHAVCNGYGVPYELSDRRLTVIGAELESSARECLPEGHNELEQQYYNILSRVESYKIEDNTLALITDAGETLVFMPQGEQTEWVLQSLNGAPTLPDQRVMLTLSDARQLLRGYGGCNFYGVPYQRDDDRIEIATDGFRQTDYLCASQDLLAQEQQYFDILLNVTNYEVDHDTLLLSTDAGDTLVFTRP
jgi:heat shock protein HslJ